MPRCALVCETLSRAPYSNLDVERSLLAVLGGKLIPQHGEVVHAFKKLAFLVLLALLCRNLRLTLYLLIVQLPPTRVPKNCVRIYRVQRLRWYASLCGCGTQHVNAPEFA